MGLELKATAHSVRTGPVTGRSLQRGREREPLPEAGGLLPVGPQSSWLGPTHAPTRSLGLFPHSGFCTS